MNKLRNIVCLFAIVFAFYGFASGNSTSENQIPKETPATDFSQEGLHLLAFIQPESAHQIITNVKSGDHFISKWIADSDFIFATLQSSKARKSFHLQDINRCEKVSLLLFPFHIFW